MCCLFSSFDFSFEGTPLLLGPFCSRIPHTVTKIVFGISRVFAISVQRSQCAPDSLQSFCKSLMTIC